MINQSCMSVLQQNCLAVMAGVSEVRQQSWTFPYVCMNKISLLKWFIVVAAPPFG
jgi:hypothetical protein